MQVELEQRGLQASLEEAIKACFKGCVVGEYFADLLVEKKVIVELKVSREYNPADEAQLLNELKATRILVGLLINFGREKVELKRMVFSDPSAFDPRSSAAEKQNGTAFK